jgi:hypothetical protein
MTGDNNNATTDEWQQKVAQWAASMGATPDNSKPKLTQRERSALEQRRMDTTDWVAKLAETNDRIRAREEARVRVVLDATEPGHGYSDEDIKAYVAKTHSDAANKWRSREHQKVLMDQAQVLHDEAQVGKAAAKAKRDSDDRLANANKVAMTYQGRAEAAEKRASSLEDQLSGMMKAQRTGGR